MRLPSVTAIVAALPRPSLRCGTNDMLRITVDPAVERGDGVGIAEGFVLDRWLGVDDVRLPLHCDRPSDRALWRCAHDIRPEKSFYALIQPNGEALEAHVWLTERDGQLFGATTLPCSKGENEKA